MNLSKCTVCGDLEDPRWGYKGSSFCDACSPGSESSERWIGIADFAVERRHELIEIRAKIVDLEKEVYQLSEPVLCNRLNCTREREGGEVWCSGCLDGWASAGERGIAFDATNKPKGERGETWRERAEKAEVDLKTLRSRAEAGVIGGHVYIDMPSDHHLKQIEVLVKMIEVNEAHNKDGSISEGIANAKDASEKLRDVYCESTGKELTLPWEPNYAFRDGFYFTGRKQSHA